ncbi:MAG: dihydrofolate reductase, partial [Chloroflexi bacterium]|nr:dihydrofolate reductase [Chloroflexota bacterium]
WQMPIFDEEAGRLIDEEWSTIAGFLFGRKTYEIFAAYWPNATEDEQVAKILNTLPKYVWSNTLEHVEWNNSHLMRGDLVEEVTRLKEQPGEGILAVIGSSRLAQSLMRHNLVDGYTLWYHPLVLGSGKRLFDDVPRMEMDLVNLRRTPSGIVILQYRTAGKA